MRAEETLSRIATNPFFRVLSGVAFALLSCSFVFAQQPSQAPAAGAANEPQPTFSSSAPPAPRFWTSRDPNAQMTVFEDTLIRVITNARISTGKAREGEPLLFTLDQDIMVDNTLIIPRGATLRGTIVQSKKAGRLSGSADLILKLDSLEFGGRSYPLYTYEFKVEGTSKTRPTEAKIKGGAVIGAIAGAAFDGSAKGTTTAAGKLAGAGTGAVLGAGVGTAIAAATPGPVLTIPAESQIDFYLSSPISVLPANEKEAARLGQGLHAGGPVLYVRGETP
jgi:hypothetical protein